jgi:hypothetical protein
MGGIDGKWRWWRVPAAGSAREGAAVVCADIDGAAPETAVAQIRAIGGRPTGIARAERGRPFSSPRGGTQRPCSGCPGSWPLR